MDQINSTVSRLIFSALVLFVSGCALAPSDPELPPIGTRLDGDVLTVIIPSCPNDQVMLAEVRARSESSVPAPSWTARDFEGDAQNGVELSAAHWEEAEGDYSSLNALDIAIETESRRYGTVVEPPRSLDEIRSLPEGSYDVDGAVLTGKEYLARIGEDFPC